MFSQVGSEAYFGVPDLMSLDGHLKEEEEEEKNEMDIEEEEEEGGENVALLVFPDPVPLLESDGAGKIRFRAEYIPPSIASIAPHVMNALSAYTEEMSKQKAAIAFHACLPIAIHASPLVSLFSGTAPTKQSIQRAWHSRYTSFVYSAYQLHQLFVAATGGCFPFAPGFTAEHVRAILNEFRHQLIVLEKTQDTLLDELYARARGDDTMHEFIALTERYCYQYVHLYEYVLHALLVAPRCALPLENVLTPHDTVASLDVCLPEDRVRILEDANMFFNHKVATRLAQERDTLARGLELVDARPLVELVHDSMKLGCPPELMFRGYIPLHTIYQYFWFLDADGVLTKARWAWTPGTK